jgi:hypothetical protein
MPPLQTIHRVSPGYVVKALVPQPYGTYIIRYQTSNDEVISDIQINKSSTTTFVKDQYVVLSVRVDQTLFKCPIMNYRLSLMGPDGQENYAQLLKQYTSQRKKREQLPKLTNELSLPKENKSWILNPKEFDGINFDEGRFGGKNNNGASKGVWHRSGQDEIKIFIKRLEKTNKHHFDNELKILKELCFFSINKLYGHYSDGKHDYIVLADGGRSLISMCPLVGRTATSRMCRIANIGFQIANAMIYLEKKNIVHRDLTASNVLVDSYGFIRIADFGHAIEKVEGKNNLSSSVTKNGQWGFQIRFLAPECISKSQTNQSSDRDYASFSSKSDVWAFGLVLIQLMISKPTKPYPDINDDDIPKHIAIDGKVHPQPTGCDIDLYFILRQCWAYQPIERISFTELREKMKMLVSIFS